MSDGDANPPLKDRLASTLRKAAAFGSRPTEEDFPELPDVLVWMRCLLGLAYGVFLGYNGTRSGSVPLQALNLVTFVPVMYCRMYLAAPSETFPGKTIFSGTFNALALCMLVWIYCFTAEHEEEGQRIASVLLAAASNSDSDAAADGGADDRGQPLQDSVAGDGVDGSEF